LYGECRNNETFGSYLVSFAVLGVFNGTDVFRISRIPKHSKYLSAVANFGTCFESLG
jgi:hypothetical protein